MIRDKLLDLRWWLGMKPAMVDKKPDRKYSISVLIPAYNEEESLAKTINSVFDQSIKVDNVIVIDDHSTDKTGLMAAKYGVALVKTDKNQGTKAKAQQYVLDKGYVNTDLFVTIDGDTILDRHAIERTLPYFNDPLTASVCGYVIPAKISTVWERGRFVEYVFGISLFKAAQNNVGAVLVSSGCFSVFRTELVTRMGGFEARTMAEDMDLTWEFALNGYHVYCAQDAYCFPYDPPTRSIFVNQIDRWFRSFFQNISIHKKDFKKNLKLAAFIYAYLLEGLLSPIIIFSFFLVATHNILHSLLLTVFLEFSLIAFFCGLEGIRIKKFRRLMNSIPAYFYIRPVNFAIFWRSLWKEWMKKEALSTWNKGH